MVKIKNNVKKAFRLPSNAVVMSMMAVILVCAAPAVVALIDDSMQSEQMIPLGSYVEGDDTNVWIGRMAGTPADADMTFSYIPGSTNNGTHVFALNTLANKTYVNAIAGFAFDNAMFDAGVSRIVLNFSGSDVVSVRLASTEIGDNYWVVPFVEVLDADGVGTNSFVCNLNSYQIAQIKANDVQPAMTITFNGKFSGVLEMTSETYTFTTIPYGEIIIGATGVLLLICALLATPWFGTSGLTIKRRMKA